MIDTINKAEYPDAKENLFQRVNDMKYSMHCSNHLAYRINLCYKNGKCLYGVPKLLQQTTMIDEPAGVTYRRRKGEERISVPYMPFLTELMDCHVNVDMTFTANMSIYLYKYLYTRPDNTRYTITTTNQQHTDNIKYFVNSHHVGASTATCTTFGFEISSNPLAVVCLTVHLPGEMFPLSPRMNGTASIASKHLRYVAHPTATQFLIF
jgi:hypothetical protein